MWFSRNNKQQTRGLTDSQLAQFQADRVARYGRRSCRVHGFQSIVTIVTVLVALFAMFADNPFAVLWVLVGIGVVNVLSTIYSLWTLSHLEHSKSLFDRYGN